jgi:prephenate dehydrogenase
MPTMTVKIAIIGLNSLGQALAYALKQSRSDLDLRGHDRNRAVMDGLDEKTMPFKAEWNLLEAVSGAQIVFLNEPLHVVQETLTILGREMKNEAVIADTAPHKQVTAEWAQSVLPDHLFYIGATPLVSVGKPNGEVFKGQRFAVVPLPQTPENALRLLTEALTLIGASPLYLELSEHDALLAAIHQLPILSGAALMRVASGSQAWRELMGMAHAPFFAATAFPVDDAEALTALLRFGREPLLRWLDGFQEELTLLRELLMAERATPLREALEEVVTTGKKWRDRVTDEDITEAALADAREEIMDRTGFRRLFGMGGRRK